MSRCGKCDRAPDEGHAADCELNPPNSMLGRLFGEQKNAKTFVIFAHAYNAYWGPERCGYGPLLSAGLYTEEEARAQEKRRPQVDRAVSLAEAVGRLESVNPEILAAIARGGK